MSALSIALQGIGFGALSVSVMGFMGESSQPVEQPSYGSGAYLFQSSNQKEIDKYKIRTRKQRDNDILFMTH